VRILDGRASFAISGELDLATEPIVRGHLLPHAVPGAEVRIDLSDVAFVDSTGLQMFVQVLRAVGDEGHLVLTGARPFVRRIIRVSGLDTHPRLTID
jgi:anti-anti-sigma factor